MNLTDPLYSDANKAREHLEALHWPEGPICPHCGCMDRITKLVGKSTRPGVYKCNDCTKPFTVTVGTIMEDSKIPLNKWLMAFALYASSKKGFSAHQLHRSLGITYKSAWFMAHRIREAMKPGDTGPFGGPQSYVEVDETFVGGKSKNRAFRKPAKKKIVVALLERETLRTDRRVRSFHVANVTAKTLRPLVVTHVTRDTMLVTDKARHYVGFGKEFAAHASTDHGQLQFVGKGNAENRTNTVEGFFSIFKRGVIGTYHHLSEAHLHRYTAEFDFRYNTRQSTDAERTAEAIKGARGKRLMYRQPDTLAA